MEASYSSCPNQLPNEDLELETAAQQLSMFAFEFELHFKLKQSFEEAALKLQI